MVAILPTYNLNGVQLLNVKEFRDLGIIVDADCLFKQHISHICRKAYCSINVIFSDAFIPLTLQL